MKGLHRSIKLSFMLVGHAKFSPDWCFGLMKRRFRISKVDCLDDLVNVVQGSASVNEVQLVGSQQGEPIVDIFDWVGFFGSHFMKIPQITRQHHFQFTAASPGTVTVKEYIDSLERQYTLTLDTSIAARNPEIIVPPGLSLKRRWYLHDKIREFCFEETRDIVCPRPESPCPQSTPPPPSTVIEPDHRHTIESRPSIVRKRDSTCGTCGQTGHNKRTCPIEDQD